MVVPAVTLPVTTLPDSRTTFPAAERMFPKILAPLMVIVPLLNTLALLACVAGKPPCDELKLSARAVVEPIVTLSRSEEHTSELQSQSNLVCRLLLEKKKNKKNT